MSALLFLTRHMIKDKWCEAVGEGFIHTTENRQGLDALNLVPMQARTSAGCPWVFGTSNNKVKDLGTVLASSLEFHNSKHKVR